MDNPELYLNSLPPAMRMAVNAVDQHMQMARARIMSQQGMGTNTMSADTKRPQAWCEFGYPDHVSNDDLYKMYERNPIAFSGVDKTVKRCWSSFPWVESESNKAWADATNKILDDAFWSAFREADRRRLAGRFSGLILRYKAPTNAQYKYADPVSRGRKFMGMEAPMPVWGTALKPTAYDADDSEKQGLPEQWMYTPDAYGRNKGKEQVIHNDRLFILGDFSDSALGFLVPCYNDLINLEKITGGTGESFLKNAARQIAIEYESGIDWPAIAKSYGIKLEDLRVATDRYMKMINRGSDAAISVQGGKVNMLSTTIADPEPSHRVSTMNVAASFTMPTKILVGSQSGERASVEDYKEWNGTCQSRRTGDINPEIKRMLESKLVPHGIIEPPPADYIIKWDDLTASTQEQRLSNAKLMADINVQMMATGDQLPFSSRQIMESAGFDDEEGRFYVG